MLHGFLPCSLVSLTESCSFWYGLKNLLNLHKLVEPLAIKTDDVTCKRWKGTGSAWAVMDGSEANELNDATTMTH